MLPPVEHPPVALEYPNQGLPNPEVFRKSLVLGPSRPLGRDHGHDRLTGPVQDRGQALGHDCHLLNKAMAPGHALDRGHAPKPGHEPNPTRLPEQKQSLRRLH